MAENEDTLPPDFTPGWPPDWAEVQRKIDAGWVGKKGKHWVLQVWGKNPISGYKVIYKAADN